jgi:hypothetical protein
VLGGIATLIARYQVDGFEPRQVSGLDDDQGAYFEIRLA